MKFSSKILSQTLIQWCKLKGVSNIVISPGSRNAPLTIGFTHHPFFKCHSVVDERCAAFFALGIAQQTQQAVALVCTSGSALLNYYPAVAEAFYSNIPLVVISADRPAHLVEIGDGQTIQQENVFGKHIVYSANCKEGKPYQHSNELQIEKALEASIHKSGPVHINIPFSEPLYNIVDFSEVIIKNPAKVIQPSIIWKDEEEHTFTRFLKQWNQSKRKMILVGVLPPNSVEQHLLDALALEDSVLVFTETTSNIHHNAFFSSTS